eukprot:787503-Amorphochlora_amoeboformis.AAC.1
MSFPPNEASLVVVPYCLYPHRANEKAFLRLVPVSRISRRLRIPEKFRDRAPVSFLDFFLLVNTYGAYLLISQEGVITLSYVTPGLPDYLLREAMTTVSLKVTTNRNVALSKASGRKITQRFDVYIT